MSEFHEQAVSDVASIDGDNYVNNLIAYAVSQRERVLQLEAELRRAQTELIFVKNAPTLELASSAEGDSIIRSIESLLAEPEREKGK